MGTGGEVGGTIALARLLARLDLSTTSGAIVAVLAANPLAFCATHPELNGERRNGNCPACEHERKQTPAYRQQQRRWHRERPEVHRASVTNWRAANQERFVAGKLARNAVRRARTGEVGAAVRQAWIALSRKAKRLAMTIDHIVPVAGCRVCGKRGSHRPANWQLLTSSENASKGNRCQACWR